MTFHVHVVYTVASTDLSWPSTGVQVVYTWLEDGMLVAHVRSPELAGGDPILIRRWIDKDDPDRLLAESSCAGFSCTRSYRRVGSET